MSSSAVKNVMMIAGEASGDLHGAMLVKALRRKAGRIFLYGIGGEAMKAAGVRIVIDAATLSVVGITEVISRLAGLKRAVATARQMLRQLSPDLLILIDFPDFNLYVAAEARRLGVPVLYYISPQLWAWRSGRVKKIKRLVDHMAVILPFEADFYRQWQVPVSFVGHPLLDHGLPVQSSTPRWRHSRIVGILPGSRDGEVARHLPIMLQAAHRLADRRPALRFLVSIAPGVSRDVVAAATATGGGSSRVEMLNGGMQRILSESRMVMAVSGTVTLETGISGIPMVIIYRVSPVSYLLGRLLIRVSSIGLVNLIAGEKIVPELIQKEASPEAIAHTVDAMLSDPARLEAMRRKLLDTRNLLGGPGASARVADIALELLAGGRRQ
jgi:lipid-A-disaccharide synthase